MKEMLTNTEYRVYYYLYMQHLSEEETAEKMNYISRENGRTPGYNSFIRIKKKILKNTVLLD